MIRRLVRQCPSCKNIVKLTIENSVITHIEGGTRFPLSHPRNLKFGQYTYNSIKVVWCDGWKQSEYGRRCSALLPIRKFTEIL